MCILYAGGLAILESVLWDAVPSYLRKLNKQCVLSLGKVSYCVEVGYINLFVCLCMFLCMYACKEM